MVQHEVRMIEDGEMSDIGKVEVALRSNKYCHQSHYSTWHASVHKFFFFFAVFGQKQVFITGSILKLNKLLFMCSSILKRKAISQ